MSGERKDCICRGLVIELAVPEPELRELTSCEQAWEGWKSFSGKFSLLALG